MFDLLLGYITNIVTDKEIGLQIKKARMEKGFSQEELGEKLGVTWEMVSRYENGRSSARKYLTQLAEALEKPVAYFFGVQDNLIEYNVSKIVDALKEKGVSYESNANKVLLVEDFSILGFEKSLRLTRQYYNSPEWITEKYRDAFALRLDSVIPESLDLNSGDIGYFSPSIKPIVSDVVLVQSGSVFKLRRFSSKINGVVLATLIAQEKRFR